MDHKSDSNPAPHGPLLQGVKVLDFTTFLSGPFATQILADLGADIIKVETFEGDSSRAIPPHFVEGDSAYYLGNNRNKRSIALNLKKPEGLALALRLIAVSDVVIENFRPGVCERLGIDIAALRQEHPALIWSSISGFGQTGPWKDKPAYDMVVQALSGVMSLTGEPNQPAMRLGIPAGDLVAGMYAVIGILAALTARGRSKAGCRIDVSMLDGQLSMLSYQAVYTMLSGIPPKPQAAQHDSIPTYRSFKGGDGREFVVTANTDKMWRDLCMVFGVPELITDARFLNGRQRLLHREALAGILEQACLAKSAADWVEQLEKSGVPVALIKSVPEALADARQAGREMVVDLEGPDGQKISVVGNPVKISEYVTPALRYPPRLAEDTDMLLQELLGLGTDEIESLRGQGVLMPCLATSGASQKGDACHAR